MKNNKLQLVFLCILLTSMLVLIVALLPNNKVSASHAIDATPIAVVAMVTDVPQVNSANSSLEQLSEQSSEQAPEQSSKQSLEQAPEQSLEQAPEQSSKQSLEQALEQAPEQSLEQAPEQSLEQAPEQSLEQAPEQSLEQAPEQSLEQAPKQAPEPEQSSASTESIDSVLLTPAIKIDGQDPILDDASATILAVTESTVASIAAELAKSYPKIIHYEIQEGDSLGAIFQKLGLSQTSLYEVLEVDVNVLALDSIKPGQTLIFTEFKGELTRLELHVNLSYQVIYKSLDGSGFEFEEVNIEGEWREYSYIGEVKNNFSSSATKAGLSLFEAQFIAGLLKDKINFSRDLRDGDDFKVLISREYIGDQRTGENRISAVRINNRNRYINAYLYEGVYYDNAGLSIEKAFVRRPVEKGHRISSSFNPRRLHPVTGLLRPHNGTDFATPIGTPIFATGDGVVSRVINHKYAGLYIELSNGSNYRTRFLHLSKALVKKGQRVTRGQKIALSGDSGRVTGAHLHYELHLNGRAVNAMTADIPIATAIDKSDKAAFNLALNHYQAALEQIKG